MCRDLEKHLVIQTRVPVSEDVEIRRKRCNALKAVVKQMKSALSMAEAAHRAAESEMGDAIAAWLLANPKAMHKEILSHFGRVNSLEEILAHIDVRGQWNCPTSPTGQCMYSRKLGDDFCLFCCGPDERK